MKLLQDKDPANLLDLTFIVLFGSILAAKLNEIWSGFEWILSTHPLVYFVFYCFTLLTIFTFWILRSNEGLNIKIKLGLTVILSTLSPYSIFSIALAINEIIFYQEDTGFDQSHLDVIISILSYFLIIGIILFLQIIKRKSNKEIQTSKNNIGRSSHEIQSTSPDQDTVETQPLSNNDVKILLERYKESWNEIRTMHDMQWKSLTIVTTIVALFLGVAYNWPNLLLPLGISSIFLIVLFALILIKDRHPFLQHMMIISRIERLLGLHNQFDQFTDGRLLPEEFTNFSHSTYKEYFEVQTWKKSSLFFLLLVFYCILASSVTIILIILWKIRVF